MVSHCINNSTYQKPFDPKILKRLVGFALVFAGMSFLVGWFLLGFEADLINVLSKGAYCVGACKLLSFVYILIISSFALFAIKKKRFNRDGYERPPPDPRHLCHFCQFPALLRPHQNLPGQPDRIGRYHSARLK